MKNSKISNVIIEGLSEGVISINTQNKIGIINRKAKEVFGIVYTHKIGHRKGVIKKGDIVVIGDNSIGLDDGGINGDDLKLLGISNSIPSGS